MIDLDAALALCDEADAERKKTKSLRYDPGLGYFHLLGESLSIVGWPDDFTDWIAHAREREGKLTALVRELVDAVHESDARWIAMHVDNVELREAAELTVQHFKRNQVSGNFQGDDEHECWGALREALGLEAPG